jgi:hypothetical protein
VPIPAGGYTGLDGALRTIEAHRQVDLEGAASAIDPDFELASRTG